MTRLEKIVYLAMFQIPWQECNSLSDEDLAEYVSAIDQAYVRMSKLISKAEANGNGDWWTQDYAQ